MKRKPGKHEAQGKKPAKGRHQAERLCGFTWTTAPDVPGGHSDHVCGNVPHNRGSHLCKNFLCSETHS